jgi:hypothetical protein
MGTVMDTTSGAITGAKPTPCAATLTASRYGEDYCILSTVQKSKWSFAYLMSFIEFIDEIQESKLVDTTVTKCWSVRS